MPSLVSTRALASFVLSVHLVYATFEFYEMLLLSSVNLILSPLSFKCRRYKLVWNFSTLSLNHGYYWGRRKSVCDQWCKGMEATWAENQKFILGFMRLHIFEYVLAFQLWNYVTSCLLLAFWIVDCFVVCVRLIIDLLLCCL